MPQDSSKSLRDTLVIPVIVGIVIVLVTYFLPKVLEKGRALSYTVDGPTTYITQQLRGVVVTVDGTPVSTLFITRVRIWNSGKDALANLPVLVFFPSGNKDFKILSVAHETQPEHEFGNIAEEGPDYQSKKFTYQLLNPNDADTITLLTTDPVKPSVYSKAEGLRTKAVLRAEGGAVGWWNLGAGLVGIFASFLSILFFRLTSRREIERRRLEVEMRLAEQRAEEEMKLARRQVEEGMVLAARQAELAAQRAKIETMLATKEAELEDRRLELEAMLATKEVELEDRREEVEAMLRDGRPQLSLEALRFSGRGWDTADYAFTVQNIGTRAAMDVTFKPIKNGDWTLQLNNIGTLIPNLSPDPKVPVGFKVSNFLGDMEQTLGSLRRFFEAATRDKGTNEVTFQVEAEFTDLNGEMRNDTFILECSMPDMKMRIRPNIKQPQ